MWLKPAREYYVMEEDLIGVFPPEALGKEPSPDALAYVVRGRGDNVKTEAVPFRPGTFVGRLLRGGLRGAIDMTGGEG